MSSFVSYKLEVVNREQIDCWIAIAYIFIKWGFKEMAIHSKLISATKIFTKNIIENHAKRI